MVVVHPKPSLWNSERNPSRRPRRDASNLSDAESPSKRMRIAYEKSGGLTPESSRRREDYFLNISPDVFGKLWEMSWIADSKEFAHEEVELDTVFERGDNWMQTLGGEHVMRSLEVRQRYHQEKGKHQVFQDRSKELLDQSWRAEVDIMVRTFKRALLCKNCGQHHLPRALTLAAEIIRECLRTKDPITVNQAMLDEFRHAAQQAGEDLLSEVEKKASKCMGTRKIWRKKIGEGRDRGDSGVSVTAELEKFKVVCLYEEKANKEDVMETGE